VIYYIIRDSGYVDYAVDFGAERQRIVVLEVDLFYFLLTLRCLSSASLHSFLRAWSKEIPRFDGHV
jgi:hypothetical protein